MTIDPAVIPGLMLLAAELMALAAIGFVVVRVVLRQTDDRVALAQGLVVGLALWGFILNIVLYAIPSLAGVLVAWGVTLAIGAGLAWRAPRPVRPQLRTTAGFVAAVLALFWVALASRQLLAIVDEYLHLGLAASIRTGGFHPPVFPWNPDLPTAYHYGANLLVGFLTPPVGPDLAFVTELLGAYLWMSFALIVITLLLQRGSWITALAIAPLLLTAGVWTQVHYDAPPGILRVPAVAPIPTAGASVSTWLPEVYWPSVRFPWAQVLVASPPNIWKPTFVLAYALALVVLERVAGGGRRSWPSALALAALVGFMGLADEAVAAMVLGLWVLLEVAQFLTARPPRADRARSALRAAAGPVLAALILVAGGGAVTGVLAGSGGTGLSLGWLSDPSFRRPIGAFTDVSGGLGMLGLGVVPVAVATALLAWRDRLAVALAVGGALFMLAALSLQYEFSRDVARLDGHARNLALLGLLVALSVRLHALRRPRWRHAVVALFVVLVTWPTAVAPGRAIALALGQGVQVTNPQHGEPVLNFMFAGRYVPPPPPSAGIVAYVRDHTAVDARILSLSPAPLSIATGRPNASGFPEFIHYSQVTGSDYLDAIRLLEPAPIQRRGWTHVHGTDAWLAGLPPRARRWIEDPALFTPLVRDGTETLYRIQPAFSQLAVAPTPESYEALRQAVPPGATVYLSPSIDGLGSIRAAALLPHARLLGHVRVFGEHLRPHFTTEPLGQQRPDLVVTSARLAPSTFPPGQRTPIWWNSEIAVYAPDGAIAQIRPPPEPLFSVRLSNVEVDGARITFTATIMDRAAGRWTGHDWMVTAADGSPWRFPRHFHSNGQQHVEILWFSGQIPPEQGVTSGTYVLDPWAPSLAFHGDDGRFIAAESAGSLKPGSWLLALRLRRGWWESGFIPVMHLQVDPTGAVTYQVYEGALGVRPIPI